MEVKDFQSRLSKIGGDFSTTIVTVEEPRWGKKEVILSYKGEEEIDGILSEHDNIKIRNVAHIGGETLIRVLVQPTVLGTQQKTITVFFDPNSPFYVKNENGVVTPNPQKLKQQIIFQLKGISDFDTYEYDFGKVDEGKEVSFQFNYLGNYQITGVKGSCGCTNVKVEGNKIVGTLNTTNIKGSVSKTVYVYFGDHERQYESLNGILVPNKDSVTKILTIKGNTNPIS